MNISTKSLNSYLQKPLTTDQLLEAIGRTEIEVEQIISSKDWDPKIVIGHVVSLRQHPNADRLKLTIVDIGSEKLSIVCGSPNIAKNQKIALALVGAKLPDGTIIRAAKIRGEESAGMICSERELGISDDHSGNLVLDYSTPIGKTLCDVWTHDTVVDIKTPANRWDYLSIVGLAREIAVFSPLHPNSLKFDSPVQNTYQKIINTDVKKMGKCGRFITVKLNLKQSAHSPKWLVENLQQNGMRSISPIVDITNFVMLELGQPAHAYDAEKIHGELTVRYGSPTETLTTLDGVKRELNPEDLIIADKRGPVGLAGVIGGAGSEVSSQTKQIILEVAQFDKTVVRRTAMRHGLRTEASARFERGLPLPLPQLAADRLVELLREVCKAEILEFPIDQIYKSEEICQLGLRLRWAEQLLGVKLTSGDEKNIINGLNQLGFEVEHFSLSRAVQRHLESDDKGSGEATTAIKSAELTDYFYQRIGVDIGRDGKAQAKTGQQIRSDQLKAGDILLYALDNTKSASVEAGLYVGHNKVLTILKKRYNLKTHQYENGQSQPQLVSVSEFVNHPHYIGARRYVTSFNHILAITVPWYRTDIEREQDICEEIIKLIGYDNLPTRLPSLPPQDTTPHQFLTSLSVLKQQLAARGLFEIMTYSFVSATMLETVGEKPAEHLRVANPMSLEQHYLRSDLLSSFLQVLERNHDYPNPFAWFEASKVFKKVEQQKDTKVEESWRIGFMCVGPDSISELQKIVQWLGSRSQVRSDTMPFQGNANWFVVGRSGELNWDDRELGWFGQLNPKILPKSARRYEVSYAEFALDYIITHPALITAETIVPYQLVERDVTLLVERDVKWQTIVQILSQAKTVASFSFVGVYEGDGVEAGNKKVTTRLYLDLGPNPTAKEIETSVKMTTKLLTQHIAISNR